MPMGVRGPDWVLELSAINNYAMCEAFGHLVNELVLQLWPVPENKTEKANRERPSHVTTIWCFTSFTAPLREAVSLQARLLLSQLARPRPRPERPS